MAPRHDPPAARRDRAEPDRPAGSSARQRAVKRTGSGSGAGPAAPGAEEETGGAAPEQAQVGIGGPTTIDEEPTEATTASDAPEGGGRPGALVSAAQRTIEVARGGRQLPVSVTTVDQRRPIPWRTIWAIIFSVAVTYAGFRLLLSVAKIIGWIVVALFFAIVMTPPVDYFQRRLKLRRGFATLIVFLLTMGVVAAMMSAFIYPLVNQSTKFADDLPQYVEDARNGKGPVGDLVERFNLEQWVNENQDKIQDTISNFGAPAVDVVKKVFATIFAGLTILVMTILMVLEGPKFSASTLGLVPEQHRERVRRVGIDSCHAVSGYVFGNLLISVIAGICSWATLKILGVPYAEVLGLFVAFSDLIPLVGATLGAVPSTLFAFLHSVTAGFVMLIFFIVYQQFENHVLQVSIMSRTVKLNPLTVFISVLLGIELLGLLGALLAIPTAGIIQVITRDVWDARGGRLKPVPTVGPDETPIGDLPPGT